jgi:uncharacterized membrane protein
LKLHKLLAALSIVVWPLAASAESLKWAPPTLSALSADGRAVAGHAGGGRQFVWLHGYPQWTASELSHPLFGSEGPTALSADGSTFVGRRYQDGYVHSAEGTVELSFEPRDVSASGDVVVGSRWVNGREQAVAWSDGQLTPLAPPAGLADASCRAEGVSADGTVVAGACDFQGVRWEDGAGTAIGPVLSVRGISADGTTIVGSAQGPTPYPEAFRWRDGVLALLGAPENESSVAVATSADGSVIVGSSANPSDAFAPVSVFLWDAEHGRRLLLDVLAARGVDTAYFFFDGVLGISDDGFVVAGSPSWIASVAPDADDDGTLDADDAFPDDPAEASDRDGDGVGDNADALPDDPAETTDADRDGFGDHSDPFPADPTRPVRATVAPGDLLVATGAGGLLRIDPATGSRGWVAYGGGFAADDAVAAPSGPIYVADALRERILRVDPQGKVDTLAEDLTGIVGLDPEERVVVSTAGAAYRVDPASRRVDTLTTFPAARIHTSAFGAGFYFDTGGTLYRADLSSTAGPRKARARTARARSSERGGAGGIIIIGQPFPTYDYPPLDVAVASHRDLVWLHDPFQGAPVVARYDTITQVRSNRVAKLPLPYESLDARAIAVGPDGALFVAGALRRVDAVEPALAVVALGPDGAFDRVLFSEALAPPNAEPETWRLAIVPPAEPPQAVDCSDALADHLPKTIASDAKSALRCMARHASGKTAAAGCTEAVLAVVSGAERRAAAGERTWCAPGAHGAPSIGGASRDAIAGLLAGLFGDLDAALATRAGDADVAACQRAASTAAARCLRARVQRFERCRAPTRWTEGPFLDAAAFAECSAASGPSCAATHLAPRLRRCAAVDVATAFPACGAADADALARCAAAQAECAACRALATVHGVPDACAEACPAAP